MMCNQNELLNILPNKMNFQQLKLTSNLLNLLFNCVFKNSDTEIYICLLQQMVYDSSGYSA